jgi:outer membrane lipoprotein carrier protein
MKKLFFLIATFLYAITLPKEFSANFTQTITSSDKKITYKGKVYKLGNEIVWNYTYPSKKTIWVKEKIYVYEPDLYQVTIINKKNTTLNDILKNPKKKKKRPLYGRC